MVMGFTTRVATVNDAPFINLLVNSAYRGASSQAGWSTEADLLDGQRTDVDQVLETIAAPGNVILVHEQDGTIVACVHLERTGAECYLGMLTVRPTLQSQGVGRRLLASAEQWAVEHWRSRAVHMTVITLREELIAWYERRGYRRTGVQKPFPYGDERFGLPRRPDLVFEVLRKDLSAND
jgi:N-acetylglutamate synthase-like GNAT family acetyltransferase